MNTKLIPLQKFYQKHWPGITDEEFEVVADSHEILEYKKGDLMLSPGEVCDWICLVNEGIVRYYYSVEGKEHIGQIYFAGGVVCDFASYTKNEPSRLYVDVVRDAEVVRIKRESVEMLKVKMPKIQALISNYLTVVYLDNFERYSSLLLDSAETRYLKLLKERPEMVQQVPLYMVASYLGITPEALSRVRNKIAQTGA